MASCWRIKGGPKRLEVLSQAIALYDTCDIKTDRATAQTLLDGLDVSPTRR